MNREQDVRVKAYKDTLSLVDQIRPFNSNLESIVKDVSRRICKHAPDCIVRIEILKKANHKYANIHLQLQFLETDKNLTILINEAFTITKFRFKVEEFLNETIEELNESKKSSS